MLMNILSQSLQHMADKILTLCKQCNMEVLPPKIIVHDLLILIQNNTIVNGHGDHKNQRNVNMISQEKVHEISNKLHQYSNACDQIRNVIYGYNQFQQQYLKLEELLQKNQTEIRKHIGIEQELKLYIDTLKIQYQESQNDRIQLLDSSKKTIKELKAKNQQLYTQNMKQNPNKSISAKKSIKKSRPTSYKKQHTNEKHNRERIKTQYHNKSRNQDFKSGNPVKLPKPKPAIRNQKKKQNNQLAHCTSQKKKLADLKKKQYNNYITKMNSRVPKQKLFKDYTPSKIKNGIQSGTDRKRNKVYLEGSHSRSKTKSNKKAHKSVFSVSSIDIDQHNLHPQLNISIPDAQELIQYKKQSHHHFGDYQKEQKEHKPHISQHFFSYSEDFSNTHDL